MWPWEAGWGEAQVMPQGHLSHPLQEGRPTASSQGLGQVPGLTSGMVEG